MMSHPVNSRPTLEPWNNPPETVAPLDWAPLSIIDLSKFDTPGGKENLASELHDAARQWGVWIVTGTGISQDELDRQSTIANAFFKLPLEDKRAVACDFSVGK